MYLSFKFFLNMWFCDFFFLLQNNCSGIIYLTNSFFLNSDCDIMASGSPDVTVTTEPSEAAEECSGNVQVPFGVLASM